MRNTKCLVAGMVLLFCFGANAALAKEYTVVQKDKTFMLDGKKAETIAISVGDTIRFQNEDSVFHNIFSLSKVMPFNLGAYDKGKSESVNFNKAGTINVECAIHPRMMIEVVVD